MNWLWLNIPLMAVFFLAMTGIPLWLVFRHPDQRPAETAPMMTIKLRGELDGGEYAVPSLVQAGR